MASRKPKPRQVDLEEAISETQADETVQQQAATAGSNSALTEDERRALTFHHRRFFVESLEAKKSAAKAHKDACDAAKAELGPDAVADIKDLIALDDPALEAAMKVEFERRLRNARWAGSKIGTQFSLIDMESDPRPAEERAYEEGKNAGMQGADRSPPYDPSVPQYGKWLTGWGDGQEILVSALGKVKADEPPVGEVEPVDTSDAPFHAPPDEMPNAPQPETMGA